MTTPQAINTHHAEDLISIQLSLEEGMTQRGAERYFRNVSKSVKSGQEDGTAYGQQIMAARLDTLSQTIDKWKTTTAAGTAGQRNSTAYQKIKDVPSTTLAFLTLKNVLAGVSTLRTLQFVAVAVGTAVEDELRFAEAREEEKRKYDRLVEGANKRGAYHYKHIYAVREADKFQDWDKWPRTDRLHVGMKLIDLCIEAVGLVEVIHQTMGKEQSTQILKALPETIEWIEKKNGAAAMLRPVYEPMIVQPRDWTSPFNGGYLSSNIKPLKMVKTKNRAYLEELTHTDMPIVYEAVNALQRTAYQINTQVLDVMSTLWENGSELGGLPPRDGLPLPAKPADIEENEAARKQYRAEASRVHLQNLQITGHRIGFNIALDIAKRYAGFRKLHFPYQLDFRGRIYAVSHLNPQGSDVQKALLRFANGKPLGSEGWKWLAIHGANTAGYDKVSLEARVEWVLDNEEEICSIAESPYDNRGWCGTIGSVEIDKPWQFLAFCFEWAGYCKYGDTYVSKLPVALDGSCSGIQHFSAMLRDEIGGNAVNLVPAELPQDVYGMVAKKVIEQAQEEAVSGTEDELKHTDEGVAYVKRGTKALAKQWLAFGITRKTTKRSVMTLAYGSKEYGFKEQLMEDIIRPAKNSGKAFPFDGDGYQAAQYMAKAIWVAVNKVLVKAGEAMRWLQTAASLAAKEGLPVRWTTPVGFPVMQAYADIETRRVKTAINGKLVYFRVNQETDKLDRRKQSSGIAPNYVHSCDAAHLMLAVVRAKQSGIRSFACVHDSFGCPAGEVETFFRVIREAFVEMYETVDVLGSFREEITQQLSDEGKEKLPALPDRGTLDLSQVVNSRFCFA
jgi:DNA-directed RNA polymerase